MFLREISDFNTSFCFSAFLLICNFFVNDGSESINFRTFARVNYQMEKMTKIVILDGYTANPGDLSWKGLEQCGEVTVYDRTKPGETLARVADADMVITGEGRVDAQTAMGKAPGSVRQRAAEHGVPVVAICGAVAPNLDAHALGFDQIIPVTPPDMPLDQAMRPDVARQNIAQAVKRLLAHKN